MLPFALIKARARLASLLAATAYAARLGIAAANPSQPTASATIEVNADLACTTRADLITRVRARSPRVRFVDEGDGLAIRVQISTSPSGELAAEVTLASNGTKPSVRHVVARSCTEAADAVALIIAVTLDPTSSDARPNSSTTKEGASRPADAKSSANPNATKADTRLGPAQTPTSPGPVAELPLTNAGSTGAGSRRRGTFGAQLAAEAFVGVAPGVMPSVALFAIAGFDRPSLWSPAFVLGVRHAWRTDIEEQGGSASFTLDAASLDVCPVRFRYGVIEARPCGTALFGRLSARGTDTFNPAAESARPFWVVGGAAVVTADLAGPVTMSARLAVGANLVRDSFEFRPATFHQVPPVSGAASLGLGLRWR